MSRVALTVNGRAVAAEVEPRTHLADFLREHLLLTGTHLGCEHGVCGACTILIDEEPARSCITYAAMCEGASVRSIEGLVDDPVMVALREAFSAEHALQCGFCTPGMLVAARDIVQRLPEADEDRIRLELAGNLCRCTGYNGIVRAIRRVQTSGVTSVPVTKAPVPLVEAPIVGSARPADAPVTTPKGGPRLEQRILIEMPMDVVWAAIQDPALVAACVPGAQLTAIEGDRIDGEMQASLGPIKARFTGQATLTFDAVSRSGCLIGAGRDKGGGTRLSGEARFRVVPNGADACVIALEMTYELKGPLAQFSRGPVVQVFASEIAATVGRNLQARLRGQTATDSTAQGWFLLTLLWRGLRQLFGRKNA